MKKRITAVLVFALILGMLAGCGGASEPAGSALSPAESASGSTEDSSTQTQTNANQADGDMFTERDYRSEYDESASVRIELTGDTATASASGVQISGSTITLTEEATYIISGTLDDGMIIVNAPDTAKLQLVLDGVSINSENAAPIYILEADKVLITLADGSQNTLSNGGAFEFSDDSGMDSVIFSRQDLTLNGSGTLAVTSPAGSGIVSKDDLVITGGTYTITSAAHGLDANDSIRITGEITLAVEAGKDGLHAENNDDSALGFVYISNGSVNIEAEGDGISAGAYMQIENGDFQILAGGGSVNGSSASSDAWGSFPRDRGRSDPSADTGDDSSTSMKGLKATGNLLISEGSFNIDSADDSVHTNASMTINGGNFEIASGDDALHADDTLTVNAGTMAISESYEGLEALHIQVQGGEITLTSSDDGLNAAGGRDSSGTSGGRDARFGGGHGWSSSSSDGSIVISGGTLRVTASGDGIDANGTLEISGGYVVITGPTQGDTAVLDYDTSATITGGVFMGTGSARMAQNFSGAEQGVISVRVDAQSAGTSVELADQNGNVLLSYTPELSFGLVILSSPDILSGQSYTLTTGSTPQEVTAS